MEFFEFFSVPLMFMRGIINFIVKPEINDVYDYSNVVLSCYLFSALGALVIYLILLVFGGIGLNRLAKKQGLKQRWMAFLPFFNTYYAGKLAGETQFFGQKMKRVGLYAMISEILYVGLQLFVLVADIISFFPEYRILELENGILSGVRNEEAMPAWIMPAIDYGSLVAYLLWFFVIVFFCVLYVSFFRKYYARGPILLAFLSAVLPFRGFTIFAVRNNAPVDYNDYIRRRTQAYMRSNGYQPPYGSYGSQNGPYGQNRNDPQNGPDPFEGFGGPSGGNYGNSGDSSSGTSSGPSSDDDPFSEFGDDKK